MVPSDGAWTLQGVNTALEGRYAIGALLAQANVQSGANTPLTTWRSGVLPSSSYQASITDLIVTQNTTPNLNLAVYPGACVILRLGAGPYLCYNTTAKFVTVNAGDATNPRRDLIVARVYDSAIGDGQTGFAIEVVTGTPAPSPSDPAIPTGAIPLCRVNVGVNATAITTANLNDLRLSTSLPGAMRVLLGGDTLSTTSDGYMYGELRFRRAQGTLPDLIDFWGTDGVWHSLNADKTCQVKWTGTVTNGANSDLFAQGGWAAEVDAYGMFHGAPGAGTYSYIQVPEDGRYDFEFLCNLNPGAGGIACGITKNAAVVTASIARDNRAAVTVGGDGTWCRAHDVQQLAANDKLYWHTWTSDTADLRNSAIGTGTHTHITVKKVSG